MNKQQLNYWQEKTFDIIIYISYILLIISSLGLSQSAPKYLKLLDFYVKIYICLFLIWRFNPFRSDYEFTDLDRKISFSAGLFILTTTYLNEYIDDIKIKVKQFVNKL
jgi:hypothetical protein